MRHPHTTDTSQTSLISLTFGIVTVPIFVVRSVRTGTEALTTEIRNAIGSVRGGLPLFGIRTMKDYYDQSLQRTTLTVALLGIAGAMALLLGIIGIYGVIAYSVSQRTREIGIRVALGAAPGALKKMFVRQGLALALLGVAIGLVASAALTRGMQALLYGVAPLDPVTFSCVPVLLALAVALASYVPARRVAKADPMQSLRSD